MRKGVPDDYDLAEPHIAKRIMEIAKQERKGYFLTNIIDGFGRMFKGDSWVGRDQMARMAVCKLNPSQHAIELAPVLYIPDPWRDDGLGSVAIVDEASLQELKCRDCRTEKQRAAPPLLKEIIYPSKFLPSIKPFKGRINQFILHSMLNEDDNYVLHRYPQNKEEKIIDLSNDRRQKIINMEWPYSTQGRISMTFKLGKCWGSGTLIGPNLVLTAGHNIRMICPQRKIFNEDTNIESIRFFPGANGSVFTFGEAKVTKTFLSPHYHWDHPDYEKYDYAVLVLDTPVGYQTGWLGIGVFDNNDELNRIHVNVTGYPGDKCNPNDHQMWTMENKVLAVQDETFHYDIDTYGGQSGSGAWYSPDEENYYIVGIHTHGGNVDEMYNISNRISLTKYNQIYEWVSLIACNSNLQIFPNISTWLEGIKIGGFTYK